MDIVRKRITQVGSGAWSIYLPKRWIDAWSDEQMVEREVELRSISQSILITPVIQEDRHEATVPDDAEAVRTLLLSGYIRGYHQVTATPATTFSNDTVAAARDFLRHLDERIVAECRAESIRFSIRSDLPPPATDDLLVLLTAKVSEVLRLAADAMQSSGQDADRCLHALRLLRDTQTEDVDRLFHQAARLVATLGIPLESVSQYQLLGLVASDLQRIGEQGVRMATSILRDMELELVDLDYPRAHLLERATRPSPPTGVARELVGVCRAGFADLAGCMERLATALASNQAADFMALAIAADTGRQRIQAAVLAAVAEHWGSDTDPGVVMAAFTASKHAAKLQNAFDHMHSICRHATGLLMAAP